MTRSIAGDKRTRVAVARRWRVAVVGKSVAGIDDPKTIATPNHGVVADLVV